MAKSVIELLELQTRLRTDHMISVVVKHYLSGTFSFDVQKHNGDPTGWSKLSGFMNKAFYKYEDALAAGLEFAENYLKGIESTDEDEVEIKKK